MAYLMIVDDDEDFTAVAARVLGDAGYEVRIELDTDSAAKSMAERPPDLLILDVMFPEDPAAGFKLARWMRQDRGALRTVPILMLTAVNIKFPLGFGPDDIDEAWMPVSDFIEKPVDLDVLQRRVDRLLGGSQKPCCS